MKQFKTAILFVLSINFFPLAAQIESYSIPVKFQEEKQAIIIKKDSKVSFKISKSGKLVVREDVTEQRLILDHNSRAFNTQSIYHSGFERLDEISGITYTKTGKKYKKHLSHDIKTSDVVQSSIFYNDAKQTKIYYSGLENGAITELKYTKYFEDPRLLDGFYFMTEFPALSMTLEIQLPKNVEIDFKALGNMKGIQFERKHKGKKTTLKWTGTNIDKAKLEAKAPSFSYYVPHVIYFVESYTHKKQTKPVLGEVKDLYGWYSELVADINKKQNEEIVAVVQKLKTTDTLQTVKNIYQWVQKNIRYVAFEDGIGGFRPRDAEEVCSKKYGDCKDMSNLLKSMLQEAGINAYLTWIGTRDKPYSYEELPTPVVDNHMITAVQINGDFLFLDGTGDYTAFGMPTSFIQGKEALIGINKDEFKVLKVPVIGKKENIREDIIELSIKEDHLLGKGHYQLSGYENTSFKYDFLGTDNSEQEDFYYSMLKKGNNKFHLDSVDSKNLDSLNKNIEINYEFQLPNYVKKVKNKYFINLNLTKELAGRLINLEKRHLPIENDHKNIHRQEITFSIPADYSLKHIPESVNFTHDKFSFSIDYQTTGNQVKIKRSIHMNHLMLQPEYFEAWNRMIKKLRKAYQEVLVLERIEG